MTDDDLSRDLERIASWGDPGSVPPIDELAGRPVRVEPPRAAPSHRRWLLAAAAAAVILVVAAIVGSRVFNDGETTMATDPDANVVQLSPEPEAMPAPRAVCPVKISVKGMTLLSRASTANCAATCRLGRTNRPENAR